MKISFEDGSFLQIDDTIKGDKVITITMCGLKNGGKIVTMSTSDLNCDQVNEIIEFLTKSLKNVE